MWLVEAPASRSNRPPLASCSILKPAPVSADGLRRMVSTSLFGAQVGRQRIKRASTRPFRRRGPSCWLARVSVRGLPLRNCLPSSLRQD